MDDQPDNVVRGINWWLIRAINENPGMDWLIGDARCDACGHVWPAAQMVRPTDYHGRPAECPQCHGLDGILQIGATLYTAEG